MMNRATLSIGVLAVVLGGWMWPVAARSESRAMDVSRSVLKIRVFKSGLFSAFAHDHEIEAPIEQGAVETGGNPAVEFRVGARRLRVLDPELAADKSGEVQKKTGRPTILHNSRLSGTFFPLL